jgi:hypothetical protein
MINQTVAQVSKDLSRLESQRNFQSVVVHIESISPDLAKARCVLPKGHTRGSETIEAKIINTPGMRATLNPSNYIGILHGDPKSPAGVQLVKKVTAQLDIRHGTTTSLFGQPGTKKNKGSEVDVLSSVPLRKRINKRNHPSGNMVILKPEKDLPPNYIGQNKITQEDLNSLIDDSSAYVSASEDEVRLVANTGNNIIINSQSGITMGGKINLGASVQDVRIGGAWRFNPMMQFQIPSTAVTPIPTLIWAPPGQGLLQGMKKYLSQIKAIV